MATVSQIIADDEAQQKQLAADLLNAQTNLPYLQSQVTSWQNFLNEQPNNTEAKSGLLTAVSNFNKANATINNNPAAIKKIEDDLVVLRQQLTTTEQSQAVWIPWAIGAVIVLILGVTIVAIVKAVRQGKKKE